MATQFGLTYSGTTIDIYFYTHEKELIATILSACYSFVFKGMYNTPLSMNDKCCKPVGECCFCILNALQFSIEDEE